MCWGFSATMATRTNERTNAHTYTLIFLHTHAHTHTHTHTDARARAHERTHARTNETNERTHAGTHSTFTTDMTQCSSARNEPLLNVHPSTWGAVLQDRHTCSLWVGENECNVSTDPVLNDKFCLKSQQIQVHAIYALARRLAIPLSTQSCRGARFATQLFR